LYVVWEIGIFRDHIKKNRNWLENTLFKSFADYLESDVSDFLLLWEAQWEPNKSIKSILSMIFSPGKWSGYFKSYITLIRLFRRIEALIISYVMVSKGGAGFELVAEQLRLCRLSRSISTSFLISFAIQFAIQWIVKVTHEKLGPSQTFMAIASLGITLIVLFITTRSYTRFCINLFAVTYTHTKSFNGDGQNFIDVKSDSDIDDLPA
jgi:hypothetical protein